MAADRTAIHGWASAPGPSQPKRVRPVCEYLDQVYVDTVGDGRVLLPPARPGPLAVGHRPPARRRVTGHAAPGPLPCTDAEREQILAGNAQRLLHLDAVVAESA